MSQRPCGVDEAHLLAPDPSGELSAHLLVCEDCRKARAEHERIGALIAQLPLAGAPPGWEARTLGRIAVQSIAWKKHRRLALAAMVGAAAAVVILVVATRPGKQRAYQADEISASVAFEIVPGHEMRAIRASRSIPLSRDGMGAPIEAHLGDDLVVHANLGAWKHYDIRVYLAKRELLVSCPGSGPPICQAFPPRLDWRLASVGSFSVLMLVSPQAIPPGRGTLDEDMAAAANADARPVNFQEIHVR